MTCRPAHGSPDVEEAIAWVAEQQDFEIEVLREAGVYGCLRYRQHEPEAASKNVYEKPRSSTVCAARIRAWAEQYLVPETVSSEGGTGGSDSDDTDGLAPD